MPQFIFIAVAILALLLWLRRLLRLSFSATAAVVVVLGALSYLALTGKLNWLFTLIATASLALIKIVSSPLGHIILGWLRRQLSRHRPAAAVFRSQYLRLRVDPFSGVVDGEVLQGQFAGQRLSQLNERQLAELAEKCAEVDSKAVRLLNIYMRFLRHFGFGGGRAEGEADDEVDNSLPSLDLACEILGVSRSDSWESVCKARQLLLARMHPDKGGSVWIAQRINSAWEVARREHPNSPKKDAKDI